MDSMEQVLEANFSEAEPKEIHALFYSDGTIGGLQVIENFRSNEIQRRLHKMPFHRRISKVNEVKKEVEVLVQKYVFVELHGNAAPDLPIGSEYLIWVDKEDQMIHNELQFGLGNMAMHGANRSDTLNASYIDYD